MSSKSNINRDENIDNVPWASLNDRDYQKFWKAYISAKSRPLMTGRTLKVVDLFASAGGLTLGAMTAAHANNMNLQSLFAVDIDSDALEIYNRNFRPRSTKLDSVANLVDFKVRSQNTFSTFAYEPEPLDNELTKLQGHVDVLLAGPPCQGHSTLNNHSRFDDPRNALYLTVPAVASVIKPQHVIIENVPTVTRDKSGVVQAAIQLLESTGYSVTSGVLAAADLGWAQTRKRFFIVASLNSIPTDLATVARQLKRQAMPLSAIIGDLVDKVDTDDYMTQLPKMSEENVRRVDWLFDNDLLNLPNDQRPDCHKNGTTYTSVYGRMSWDKPAPTLTTGFLSPGRGRFVHPLRRRVLTPREAARVQGFPDWFQFVYEDGRHATRTSLSKWIGDAVPSILGSVAVSAALTSSLNKIKN